MTDILITDFPMKLNGRWGSCSDHIIIHGDGSVTYTDGHKVGEARAVQVIRCKDCSRWDTSYTANISDTHYCYMVDKLTKADCFCYWGKRREE